MSAKMIVVYRRPADPAAFEKHYFETHVPLAKQLPGLRSYEVSRGPVAVLANAPETHFVAVLTFDDMAAMRSAFASEIGAQCAADRKLMAADADVQTFLFEGNAV
jgi:uncharacterized protein (TIGR02118 family)